MKEPSEYLNLAKEKVAKDAHFKNWANLEKKYKDNNPEVFIWAMDDVIELALKLQQEDAEKEIDEIKSKHGVIISPVETTKEDSPCNNKNKSETKKKTFEEAMERATNRKDENEIITLIDSYWKFDNNQQPAASWHEKQNLLEAVRKLLVKKKPIICPNCDRECNPIPLGQMCNLCYYDKL